MKLALDTNASKALDEGEQHLAEEVRRAELIGLPIIVLGELWFGFMNGSKLRENTGTLERFLATPRVQVLQLGEQTSRGIKASAVLGLEVVEIPSAAQP